MPLTSVEAARVWAGALEQSLEAMPQGSRGDAQRALRRLQDVVLPRLEDADAPLLIVVGGSTGSGKSTLVNSLLGRNVSRAGAVRPTTRRPVLICSPQQRDWFMSDRVLPRLAKSEGSGGDSLDAITIAVEETLWPTVGIVDAPDIDSVEDGNRRLASELLDGADLWVFVTTAARYADAVAWKHLEEAGSRGLRVAIVLNRVPVGAAEEVREDLASLARQRGLGEVMIVTVEEQPLTDGRLPAAAIAPIGAYLESIGRDAQERAAIVRRSLSGAVSSSLQETAHALEAARERNREFEAASEDVRQLISSYAREASSSSSDDVLRGEVSARIAEVLGSWDMTKTVSRVFSGLSSRLMGAIRGQAAPDVQVQRDLTGGLAQRLADQYHRAWQESVRRARSLVDTSSFDEFLDVDAVAQRARRVAQEWTSEVTELIRAQAESSRVSGRMLAGGINVVTVSLMVAAFTMTGGLTGVEVGIAGASAALSQTVLEAYFGERTVRSLAEQARDALERLAAASLSDVVEPVSALLDRSDEGVRLDALEQALGDAREVLA
ncbi:dynamin family protein [Pauljensenia sp. UMB3104]|uniref:dynamin family protein n=1 Tax=Pauljensenia sp. UMB3104 TaxID=3046331 RepID=UPI00254DD278|nr:dynamin family protein [Pauljensenia sp. UMB3104]